MRPIYYLRKMDGVTVFAMIFCYCSRVHAQSAVEVVLASLIHQTGPFYRHQKLPVSGVQYAYYWQNDQFVDAKALEDHIDVGIRAFGDRNEPCQVRRMKEADCVATSAKGPLLRRACMAFPKEAEDHIR